MSDCIRITSTKPLRLQWPCGCVDRLVETRNIWLSDGRRNCFAYHPPLDPTPIVAGIALGAAMRKAGRT